MQLCHSNVLPISRLLNEADTSNESSSASVTLGFHYIEVRHGYKPKDCAAADGFQCRGR